MRVVVLASLAVLAGCAGAPGVPDASGPPPFQGLRRLVLVRAPADRDARPKDPLDAVRESLVAAGRGARELELGRGGGAELAPLARLYARVESRVAGAVDPGIDPGASLDGGEGVEPARVERVGGDVRPVLDRLQADGAVLFYRFSARMPPPSPSPFGRDRFGTPAAPLAPPAGALALLDRDGNLTWFEWGGRGGEATVPATAAEAVEALLRVIDGQAPGAPDA